MRLDNLERTAIQKALAALNAEGLSLDPKKIFLFGSRADDNKRGGDIDLLIFSTADPFTLSRRFAVHFFNHCEEKIDVIVMDEDNLTVEQQAFLNTLTLVQLYE